MRENIIQNLPESLREELNTFVIKENGKREALSGCHDDHVMAFGITLMMVKHNPYYEQKTGPSTYMGRETSYNRR